MRRRLLLGVLANTFKWLKDKFIYIYNSIIPSKLPSVNVWDEDWESGKINSTTGETAVDGSNIRTKNFIKINPNSLIYLTQPSGYSVYGRLFFYDVNKNYIGNLMGSNYANREVAVPTNACYMKAYWDGNTYNHDICINVSDPQINGIYYPYKPKKVQEKARLSLVEGNSEVSNNHLKNGNFESSNGWGATRGTIAVSNNIATYSVGEVGNDYTANRIATYSNVEVIKKGNYVFIALKVYATKNTTINIYATDGNGYLTITTGTQLGVAQANKWNKLCGVYKLNSDRNLIALNIGFNATANNYSINDTILFTDIELVDLTQRFPFDTPRSVNDPRVQNIIRQGYKDFNAGEIKDSVVSEIEHTRVPKGFKELTYIESSGTQYIDTGVIGKYGLSTYAKVCILTASHVNARLLGSRIDSGETRFYVGYSQYMSSINLGYRIDNASGKSPTPNVINEYKYNASGGKLEIVENGVTIYSTTTTDTTFNTNLSMFIFGNNYANAFSNPIEAKLYALKIWDNGKLVRDFIPCYRESDNEIGLYDAVNGVFYTNAGTGTFVKGEEVEQPHQYLPVEYQEVEYLESHGTEYIDSGVTLDYSKSYSLKMTALFPNQDGTRSCFFSNYNNDTTASIWCEVFTNSFRFGWDNSQILGGSVSSNVKYNVEFKKVGTTGSALVNGSLINTATDNRTTLASETLLLFRDYRTGIFSNVIRCYKASITIAGVIVRNFIPCYRKSDNVAGLYDLVNGVFYVNQGTGTFAVGKKVNHNSIIRLPQPLKLAGVGTAHNTFEITKTNYVFTRKVFDVDLGSLDWNYNANWNGGGAFYPNNAPYGIKIPATSVKANGISRYETFARDYLYANPSAKGLCVPDDGRISVRDSAYNDATTFKNANVGVKLTYELATPQVINIPRKHLRAVKIKDISSLTFHSVPSSYSEFFDGYMPNDCITGTDPTIVQNIWCSQLITINSGAIAVGSTNMRIALAHNTQRVIFCDYSVHNVNDFLAKHGEDVIFYETQNEVADFIDELECQPNGVLNANQSRVPHEYQEVEYIESSGTQWIDSNVNLGGNDFEVSCDFLKTKEVTSEQAICSIWLSSYNYWNLFIRPQEQAIDIYTAVHNVGDIVELNKKYNVKVKRSSNSWSFGLDNDLDTFSYTPATSNPTSLKLFTRGDTPDQSGSDTNIKMYSFTLKVAGVLTRDFVPCFRKSDGVIGLYDVVEGKFYTNQGTGSFLKGGNVNNPICETLPNVEVVIKCK